MRRYWADPLIAVQGFPQRRGLLVGDGLVGKGLVDDLPRDASISDRSSNRSLTLGDAKSQILPAGAGRPTRRKGKRLFVLRQG